MKNYEKQKKTEKNNKKQKKRIKNRFKTACFFYSKKNGFFYNTSQNRVLHQRLSHFSVKRPI